MSSRLLFSLIFTTFLIPLSTFAQTSDNIPLDSRNHFGEISVKTVKVSEKEFYKVIILNIEFTVKDLGLEDIVSIYPDSIKLINENGKVYFPNRDECTLSEPLVKVPDGGPCFKEENECGKPSWWFDIKGTGGGIKNYHPCFRVEKEFNNFRVYYTLHVGGLNYKDFDYLIGDIAVDQKLTTDVVSDIKNINMTKPQDFFAQFFEWIKNLFKFS